VRPASAYGGQRLGQGPAGRRGPGPLPAPDGEEGEGEGK
jgi:hypothetical protein